MSDNDFSEKDLEPVTPKEAIHRNLMENTGYCGRCGDRRVLWPRDVRFSDHVERQQLCSVCHWMVRAEWTIIGGNGNGV